MNGPAKIYFSISEVCEQTGLEPHVLRYWESEFPQLRPKKNRAGNRAYRAKDIALIEQIRGLLYEEKFTIPGAKKRLAQARHASVTGETESIPESETPAVTTPDTPDTIPSLKTIKDELGELLRLLTT